MKKFFEFTVPFAALLLLSLVTSCTFSTDIPAPTLSPDIVLLATAQASVRTTSSPMPTMTVDNVLGWGSVQGKITDIATGEPIVGAKITCRQYSVTSRALCDDSVLSAADGTYLFPDVFFLASDYFEVMVEAPGYQTQTVYVNSIETALPVVDLRLVPILGTGTPQTMTCTLRGCVTFTPVVTPTP